VVNERVHFDPDNVRAHELGKRNYDEAMKRDDRRVFVAEEQAVILGVATFFILTDFITGKPFAHIDDFVVDKAVRKMGIGSQLLEFIKTYAKKQDICTIELTSSLPLMDAHRFYEKRGGVYARKVIKFTL
jgi:GNAT superfamily N-acetyltransferase